MNRISVLVAAGAFGTVALTAGCSSSTSAKSAGSGAGSGSTLGSTSSAGSTSSSSPGANPAGGSVSSSAATSAPSSAAGGTSAPSSAPTTAASAPTHSGTPACSATEMPSGTWRVVPDSQGAGHVAADIALQNTSGHTCTVTGFPGVSLLASNDHPLPTNVVKDNAVAVKTLTVAPGGWVHSEMRYSPNVPGPGEPQNGGQCEPMTVHALAQLPGSPKWSHITLDNPTPVCEKGQLQSKAFVSGESSPTGG